MKKVRIFAVIVFLCISANVMALPIVPVYNDLWDISNGTIVTGNSPTFSYDYFASSAFGGTKGSYEIGNVLFQDGHAPPYTNFIEWQTSTIVSVKAFNLFAGGDTQGSPDTSNPAYARRSFAAMRLYAWEGNSWVQFFDAVPTLPYFVPVGGTNGMPFSLILPNAVSSNRWRVEFDQQVLTNSYDGAPAAYYGPRIVELDAFATPEPCSLILLGLGGLLLRRKK